MVNFCTQHRFAIGNTEILRPGALAHRDKCTTSISRSHVLVPKWVRVCGKTHMVSMSWEFFIYRTVNFRTQHPFARGNTENYHPGTLTHHKRWIKSFSSAHVFCGWVYIWRRGGQTGSCSYVRRRGGSIKFFFLTAMQQTQQPTATSVKSREGGLLEWLSTEGWPPRGSRCQKNYIKV